MVWTSSMPTLPAWVRSQGIIPVPTWIIPIACAVTAELEVDVTVTVTVPLVPEVRVAFRGSCAVPSAVTRKGLLAFPSVAVTDPVVPVMLAV